VPNFWESWMAGCRVWPTIKEGQLKGESEGAGARKEFPYFSDVLLYLPNCPDLKKKGISAFRARKKTSSKRKEILVTRRREKGE